jgi:hypothetical protein
VKPLEEKIKDLPPERQRVVEEFVDSLTARRSRKPRPKPTFKWEGALADLKDQYTSMVLRHELRGERLGKR